MRVYVESNFPLEIARGQEEYNEAHEILRLAERGKLSICYPALALTEPFSTLLYYGGRRTTLIREVTRELGELARSQSHAQLAINLQPFVNKLTQVQEDETDRLEDVVQRLVACGTPLHLTSAVFGHARTVEPQHDLIPQDAIVFASVMADLKAINLSEESCFVSRNSKDFGRLKNLLAPWNCRYIAKFTQALSFIKSK